MRDIISAIDGQDLGILDTPLKRAENLLTVQLDSLEYAEGWGVDLDFFLQEDLEFQNESFKSYLLQRMAENSIDVSSVIETVETFYQKIVFNLTEAIETDSLMR